MEDLLTGLASILDLKTDLASNCLDGVDEESFVARLPGGGNSLAFLFAHVADARYYLVGILGAPLENPLESALADARSIDDLVAMPTRQETMAAWDAVSAHLAAVLAEVPASALSEPTGQSFPIGGGTLFEALAFLTHHDTYHIGQMAFLRRQLGLPAMEYRRAPSRTMF